MPRRFRILQVHWGFPPTIGGVETHLTVLLPELVVQGHKVALMTGSFPGESPHDQYRGVDVYRNPLLDLNWLVKRGLDGLEPDIEGLFTERLDEFTPDVVHVHNMHYFSEPHARILQRLCKERHIPLVLTAHNVWDDTLFLRLTRDIDWSHIIAVSHYIRMELHGVGIDDRRTTTIHHGINIAPFSHNRRSQLVLRKYPQLKNRKVVFHPARIGIAKGCDVTIKAMRVVVDRLPEAMLILAGSKNIIDWSVTQEKDIAYFIDLIRTLDLEKHVLIDVFPIEAMPDMYSVSDVVVYPSSVAEPFGLTMLEAFAARRPIVVTDMGGMPEVVQNEISGYIVHQRDYELLSDRIISLLRNARLRRRIGENGRRIVEQHYTPFIMTRAHLRVYAQVLREEGGRRRRQQRRPVKEVARQDQTSLQVVLAKRGMSKEVLRGEGSRGRDHSRDRLSGVGLRRRPHRRADTARPEF
jgi:glycosyltransferase involved in cell wall biosynthesis